MASCCKNVFGGCGGADQCLLLFLRSNDNLKFDCTIVHPGESVSLLSYIQSVGEELPVRSASSMDNGFSVAA